jgi:valyl-tRNA synthetase
VRYWAASGRPGTDTAFDPNQMRVGRRLAIKLLNASRFALAGAAGQGAITAPVDRAILRALGALVDDATRDLEGYDYARALQRTEEFFWRFCDDYLELIKGRRYGEQGEAQAASANATLAAALSVLLRLFAPFLPFVTEEVWSWWQDGSVHTAAWPARDELTRLIGDASVERGADDRRIYDWATTVLADVRKQRSEAKQPLRVAIERVSVRADREALSLMTHVEQDLKSALKVRRFDIAEGAPRAIVVEGYETAAAGTT